MAARRTRPDDEEGLGDNPLADAPAVDPLAEAFYGAREPTAPSPPAAHTTTASSSSSSSASRRRKKGRQPLGDGKNFRLVTFSFYEDDVARLEELLDAARAKGHPKASRSQIVRLALRQVDLSALPDDI